MRWVLISFYGGLSLTLWNTTCAYTFTWGMESYTAWKVSKYGVISGPYFPVFGLNTERYSVYLRIRSEYRKIPTRNNSIFGHISHSANLDQNKIIGAVLLDFSKAFYCIPPDLLIAKMNAYGFNSEALKLT